MLPSERLASLGLALPVVPEPAGLYVPALHIGGVVRSSGHLAMVGGELRAAGLVGEGPDRVDPDLAAECARIAALNALAALAAAAGDLDQIVRVTRVVGYVASAPGFHGQPAVVNGASQLMVDVFSEAGRHVRSAVGVAALPLRSPVEIEIEALTR